MSEQKGNYKQMQVGNFSDYSKDNAQATNKFTAMKSTQKVS
jgi:hypothetical protein